MSSDKDQKRKKTLIWKCQVIMTGEDAYINNKKQLQNRALSFICKKITSFGFLSRLPMAYSTTASGTSYLLPNMWTLANAKADLDVFFLVQKWFQLPGCKTQIFRERWEQRVPTGTNTCNRRGRFQPGYVIDESAGHCSRKTLPESGPCLQLWYQHCPKTWMNNSNWLPMWLT